MDPSHSFQGLQFLQVKNLDSLSFLPSHRPPPPILSSPPQLSQLSTRWVQCCDPPLGTIVLSSSWNEREILVSLNIHIIEIFQRDKESYKAIHIS